MASQTNSYKDDGVASLGRSSPPCGSLAESSMRQLGMAARSSSPAKRSASEIDKDDETSQYGADKDVGPSKGSPRSPKKSFLQHVSPMPSRFKSTELEIKDRDFASPDPMDEDFEPGFLNSHSNIAGGSEESPTLAEADASAHGESSETISYDEQMETIMLLIHDPKNMYDGSKGYVIARRWIDRVRSRTTGGLHEPYDKSVREGDIGPVDNSSIIQTDVEYEELKDESGDLFVPIRSDLAMQRDFDVVPEQAWGLIVQWYGVAHPTHCIVRYARITTDPSASAENLQYELFPPICMLHKLQDDESSSATASKNEQNSPARVLITSRTAPIQNFLRRAKAIAGIEKTTRVQIWRLLETLKANFEGSGIPTPATSRGASPAPDTTRSNRPGFLLDLKSFLSLGQGTERELLDFKDETTTEHGNDSERVDGIGLPAHVSLVLEERIGDSGNEFFPSDRFKTTTQLHIEDGRINNKEVGRAGQDPARLSANTGSARTSPGPSGISTRGRMGKKGRSRGGTGLVNLGNTCYMNSALQCIRSVEELTLYFLEGKAQGDINTGNPLGHGGQIAKAYQELVRRLFAGNASFSPQDFRRTLGRCQPLFSGYGQQDSQEFLSFLVDGLHEDLNRVIKKPYIENPESDDSTIYDPDAIQALGEKFRNNHRARNDSVAMDLFNGFYKNTMICPVCEKISITFDPYSLLTLQLPISQPFQHVVTFAPLLGSPVSVAVDMDRSSSIRGLKDSVGARVGVPGERLVMAEMYNGKFYKIFEDAEILSEASIQPADKLVVCELDQAPTNWPPNETKKAKNNRFTIGTFSGTASIPGMESVCAERMAVPVIHRVKGTRGMSFDLFPSFILITKEEARDTDSILRKVLRHVNNLTTRDIFEDTQDPVSQEPSSRAESDTLAMEDLETSSSDDPKVQARSVEGEDGLVDISMTDGPTAVGIDRSNHLAREISSSRILDPGFSIQSEWRRYFNMRLYNASGEMIPCAWSSLSENTRLPPLQSKQASSSGSSSRRQSDASKASQNQNQQGSQSSEDDEFNKSDSNHYSTPQGLQSSSTESDSESQIQSRARSPASQRIESAAAKAGNLISLKKAKQKKLEEASGNEYAIHLGQGIVLDWSEDGLEKVFNNAHHTYENMEILSDPELDARKAKRAVRKKQGISLEECFEETSKSEVLSEDNAWYCNRCKELRRATKKLEIWTVPDILVIHLKRFSTNSRLRDKIDVLIDFPVEALNLDGKVGLPEGNSLVYDLFAVDNHYGGLGGGHYTAYARNFVDRKWYDYNDQMVSSVSPNGVVTRAAYLLFYRRRSGKPLGGKYLEDVVLTASTTPELGGEFPPDDTVSIESSSTSFAPEVDVNDQISRHYPGPLIEQHDLDGSNGNDLLGNPPPYKNNSYDEGIGMEEDSEPAHGIEEPSRAILGSETPTWSFAGLNEGVNAPPGSSNGASAAGSDRPEAGDILHDRIIQDFGDDLSSDHLKHISLSGLDNEEDDSEVAEIKVGSDNEDGP